MALEEEIPEFKDGDDKTVPKYKQIDKRAGEYIVDWGTELEEQHRARAKEQGGKVGLKREADEMSVVSKKPKVEAKKSGGASSGVSTDQLKKRVNDGTLSKMTVADLKGWLSENGLDISGKKADLVDRIEQWFES